MKAKKKLFALFRIPIDVMEEKRKLTPLACEKRPHRGLKGRMKPTLFFNSEICEPLRALVLSWNFCTWNEPEKISTSNNTSYNK